MGQRACSCLAPLQAGSDRQHCRQAVTGVPSRFYYPTNPLLTPTHRLLLSSSTQSPRHSPAHAAPPLYYLPAGGCHSPGEEQGGVRDQRSNGSGRRWVWVWVWVCHSALERYCRTTATTEERRKSNLFVILPQPHFNRRPPPHPQPSADSSCDPCRRQRMLPYNPPPPNAPTPHAHRPAALRSLCPDRRCCPPHLPPKPPTHTPAPAWLWCPPS
jgi:hypothetical protein